MIILCILIPEGWGSCDPASVLLLGDLTLHDPAGSTGEDVLASLTIVPSCITVPVAGYSNNLVHYN